MRILLALLLLVAAPQLPAHADEFNPAQRQEMVRILRDALTRDPTIIREALSALQTDELRRQDKVTRDVIAMIGPRMVDPADPVVGSPFADVTIVEFFDTRCPYCRRMLPVMAELLRDDLKLKVVLKDLPVLGPNSELEARALLAAKAQGGYLKMLDAIMVGGGTASRDNLRDLAERLGLDGARLLRDMDDPVIKARLKTNLDLAQQLGIEGTPALVIGDRLIGGFTDLGEMKKAIAEARAR